MSGPSGGLSPQKSEDGIGSDVECFQNFTAPEVFTQGLAGMINQQDIATIIRSQKYMQVLTLINTFPIPNL